MRQALRIAGDVVAGIDSLRKVKVIVLERCRMPRVVLIKPHGGVKGESYTDGVKGN